MEISVKKVSLYASLLALSQPALADDKVLYCAESHNVGMSFEDGVWGPFYSDKEGGRRYAIRFNETYTEMTGFQGGDTKYQCGQYFPTKARDIVTCVNPLVATMVFSFSTDTGHFVMNMTSPGGWLGVGTDRETNRPPLFDRTIFRKCQDFQFLA